MSTEVKSVLSDKRVVLDSGGLDRVSVFVHFDMQGDFIVVPRSDFLAAVATECDAIVIPRETLHEVRRFGAETRVGGDTGFLAQQYANLDAEQARAFALRLLALAEYLDSPQRVDEAEVEALSALLMDTSPGGGWRDHAAALLATGRIEVKP